MRQDGGQEEEEEEEEEAQPPHDDDRPSGGRGRNLSLRYSRPPPLRTIRRFHGDAGRGQACAQSICTLTGKIRKFVDFLIVVQLIHRLARTKIS